MSCVGAMIADSAMRASFERISNTPLRDEWRYFHRSLRFPRVAMGYPRKNLEHPAAKRMALLSSFVAATKSSHRLPLRIESTLILVFALAGIHPVREALRAGRPLDRMLIAKGAV